MTHYDVYGLGNALLDIECEVTADVLEQLGVEKGVMTLLDEESQNNIIAHLDGKLTKRACGGSAANTMIAISQFGGKGFYSCKVANDEPGNFYFQDLKNCGLSTNLESHDPEPGITGKCLVFVTPDADRTMNTFLGISGGFSEAELLPEAIANSQYTYIEGYLVTGEGSRKAAIRAREIATEAQKKVAFTLADPNMVKFFKEGLLEIIGPGVDFLFANDSEALAMAGTDQMDEAIAYLKTLAKGFAITRGAQGSLIYDGNELIEIAPYPVKAVDTVGAGDIYAGSVLYGLTHDLGYARSGQLGSLAASRLVTSLGPRLKTDEIQALLAEF